MLSKKSVYMNPDLLLLNAISPNISKLTTDLPPYGFCRMSYGLEMNYAFSFASRSLIPEGGRGLMNRGVNIFLQSPSRAVLREYVQTH